jgi:hypothetical protein
MIFGDVTFMFGVGHESFLQERRALIRFYDTPLKQSKQLCSGRVCRAAVL